MQITLYGEPFPRWTVHYCVPMAEIATHIYRNGERVSSTFEQHWSGIFSFTRSYSWPEDKDQLIEDLRMGVSKPEDLDNLAGEFTYPAFVLHRTDEENRSSMVVLDQVIGDYYSEYCDGPDSGHAMKENLNFRPSTNVTIE